MNKKIAIIMTAMLILLLVIIPSYFTANENITVKVNGKTVIFDTNHLLKMEELWFRQEEFLKSSELM